MHHWITQMDATDLFKVFAFNLFQFFFHFYFILIPLQSTLSSFRALYKYTYFTF